jgi:hypothetical protein
MRLYTLILLLFINNSFASKQFNCGNNLKIDTHNVTTYIHQIENKENTLSNKARLYESLFKSCIQNRQPVEELSKQALHRLYNSMLSIVFYTNNIAFTDYMKTILDEKIKRGEKNKHLINEMHYAYIKTRQFRHAEQLEKQFPDINFSSVQVIESIKNFERSLLHIENKGRKLVQKPFTLPKSSHIIVVSSPMCSASRRFLFWLQSKPDLLALFAKKSTWIIPVDGRMYLKETQESNIRNTPIIMQYTYKQTDWPEIEYWGTPTLYFYQDGKLKNQLIGWPSEGREHELTQALKLIRAMI